MTLNPKQIKIVTVSVVIFIAMVLYPPWICTLNYESLDSEQPAGYALIFASHIPECEDTLHSLSLDIKRLFVQWILLAIATGYLVLLAKGPRKEKM